MRKIVGLRVRAGVFNNSGVGVGLLKISGIELESVVKFNDSTALLGTLSRNIIKHSKKIIIYLYSLAHPNFVFSFLANNKSIHRNTK